jgi:hypothetical protein
MATNSSAIQKKIETLKKGLNNKFITASQKEKIKSQVEKLESQAKALAPKKASKPAATSLTRLQKMVNNKKYGVYKGKGVDLQKDSNRPAKAIGKRTSKSGKTYYEYRANRIDVKQPPKRYPKLAEGGYMAKGGSDYGKWQKEHFNYGKIHWDKLSSSKKENLLSKSLDKNGIGKDSAIYKKRVMVKNWEELEYPDKLYVADYFVEKNNTKMADGGTIEDRYTIYGTSDEGWFVVDKETKRQIHPSEFGRNSWETKQELLADLKSKQMAKGGYMADGGVTVKEVVESNADMVLSQIKAVKHHAEELSSVVSRKSNIEAWVVGKIERASTDLSDITHYLEGNKDKMSMGGTVRHYAHKMDKK